MHPIQGGVEILLVINKEAIHRFKGTGNVMNSRRPSLLTIHANVFTGVEKINFTETLG